MKRECIDKLAKLLDKADVPYERRPMWTDIYHEEKELTAKDYYEGLIERWRERIDEINAHTDPESQSRAEWDVLEEVIFEVSLGFPLLK